MPSGAASGLMSSLRAVALPIALGAAGLAPTVPAFDEATDIARVDGQRVHAVRDSSRAPTCGGGGPTDVEWRVERAACPVLRANEDRVPGREPVLP